MYWNQVLVVGRFLLQWLVTGRTVEIIGTHYYLVSTQLPIASLHKSRVSLPSGTHGSQSLETAWDLHLKICNPYFYPIIYIPAKRYKGPTMRPLVYIHVYYCHEDIIPRVSFGMITLKFRFKNIEIAWNNAGMPGNDF